MFSVPRVSIAVSGLYLTKGWRGTDVGRATPSCSTERTNPFSTTPVSTCHSRSELPRPLSVDLAGESRSADPPFRFPNIPVRPRLAPFPLLVAAKAPLPKTGVLISSSSFCPNLPALGKSRALFHRPPPALVADLSKYHCRSAVGELVER